MRVAVKIELTEAERSALERLSRGQKVWQSLARRARIVLLAADGKSNLNIADILAVTPLTVSKWRKRFAGQGLDGLHDEPRPGAPRKLSDDAVAAVVRKTLEETPRDATHWSLRSMADAVGYAPSTVHRIWRAFPLQPHRSETFKVSKDAMVVDKVRDIVGLSLDPPQHAMVLCVDEKGQVQALDRTQPLLPMRPGQMDRRTHDDKRNGTTSLFAALDVATGKIIGRCYRRHRSTEFRKFLNQIEKAVPDDLDSHIVMDNDATHKTHMIRDGFARRPRWHAHVTPTSGSWLNQVERFFADITEKQLRRGIHRSTQELEQAILDYRDTVNQNPRPFRWHKSADEILAAIKRFCLRTLEIAENTV